MLFYVHRRKDNIFYTYIKFYLLEKGMGHMKSVFKCKTNDTFNFQNFRKWMYTVNSMHFRIYVRQKSIQLGNIFMDLPIHKHKVNYL